MPRANWYAFQCTSRCIFVIAPQNGSESQFVLHAEAYRRGNNAKWTGFPLGVTDMTIRLPLWLSCERTHLNMYFIERLSAVPVWWFYWLVPLDNRYSAMLPLCSAIFKLSTKCQQETIVASKCTEVTWTVVNMIGNKLCPLQVVSCCQLVTIITKGPSLNDFWLSLTSFSF